MIMLFRHFKLKQNESGFAALVIGIVLVVVISLLTVGFAQLMQKEQASALNKQLSSQAYYAAESGINDAVKALNDGYTETKSSCGDTTAEINPEGLTTEDTAIGDLLNNNTIGGTSGPTDASYPCLLIDSRPPNLEFSPIAVTGSKVAKVEGVDDSGNPQTIKSISISWKDAAGGTNFAPSGVCSADPNTASKFYPLGSGANQWDYTGLIRFELIPINSLDRQSLINNEFTTFLCPGTGDGSFNTIGYSSIASSNGPVVSGNCDTALNNATYEPDYCNVMITNLGSGSLSGESTYYIDMQSIYNPTSVTISAYTGDGTATSSNQLYMAGDQTLIDSTGKAHNVLRRIQVRVSAINGYDMPTGTHASDDICKQLQLAPVTGGTNPSLSSGNCTISP